MTDEQFSTFVRSLRRVDPTGERSATHERARGVIVEFPWREFVLIRWDGEIVLDNLL